MRIDIERATTPHVPGALFAWFSPAFPTGGFAWSHGLESAAQDTVRGEAGLADWLADILVHGSGWSDAVLMALAWRSGRARDPVAWAATSALCLALCPSRERAAETLGQGEAFAAAIREGWPQQAPPPAAATPYPCAAGWSTAVLGAPVETAVAAFLTGFASNLIAAGVRLSLCGQVGGVRILSRLSPLIADLCQRAAVAEEDDLGGCALSADIASMRHETLDGRLFLS